MGGDFRTQGRSLADAGVGVILPGEQPASHHPGLRRGVPPVANVSRC